MVDEPALRRAIDERTAMARKSRFWHPSRTLLAKHVAEVENGQARVLEIGCGYLDFTLGYLRPACAEVVATDIEKRFPDSRELPEGVTFELADGQRLPFDDESFDCVIAIEVIEHVEDEDGFYAEALRVARPGGTVIVTTPNRHRLTALAQAALGRPIRFPHTYAIDPALGEVTHLREYSHRDLERLFARHRAHVAEARINGICFGVPAWQLTVTRPPFPLDRLAFNWHTIAVKR